MTVITMNELVHILCEWSWAVCSVTLESDAGGAPIYQPHSYETYILASLGCGGHSQLGHDVLLQPSHNGSLGCLNLIYP